jgi:hypothetical protein
MAKTPRLGTGKRAAALRRTLAARADVRDPDALTAWIGRKHYGKTRMARWAAQGRRRAAARRRAARKDAAATLYGRG